MIFFKEYIASNFIGKRLRFNCDCTFPMDIIGTIVDYEIIGNEIIFKVKKEDKIVRVSENHPKLMVEILAD